MAQLPDPGLYSDWKAFASKLITALEESLLQPRAAVPVQAYSKTRLPKAANPGDVIYVVDETGGAVLAFADGTNWRRVTDRAIVA
jgi:hypothetical protein